MDALRKSVSDTKTSDTKTSAAKSTTTAPTKSASRKGPTLIKSASKSHATREAKPTRTSPKRKTA